MILADKHIAALYREGAIISAKPFTNYQIQPASLDLRLGKCAWRVRASFLPGYKTKVADKLDPLIVHELDLQKGVMLEVGCVYIVPLLEKLRLPDNISAVANPKSSTGRLDVFTRVLTDGAREFDRIPAGYRGQLYLEISPQTFPIIVRTGSSLSQIRFCSGTDILDEAELRALQATDKLVSSKKPDISSHGIALSVDLQGQQRVRPIGYRAKRHTSAVDVDQARLHSEHNFWEPIYDCDFHKLILDPDEFYILASQEMVHVPPAYAAEMTPLDPRIGEFRVHYAGFFDPGFGHKAKSRAVFEVRSHEVPFIIEHGQTIGRLVYERMLEVPDVMYDAAGGSNYYAQGLQLSKHFTKV